ncbi:MAG TPA: hypothetical protein VLL52_06720 [Anaerolineae bacterium]|nr:hypothetical protein [Anaerolineae bacterium]
MALITHTYPLREALYHMVRGGHTTTYVWKSSERDSTGFVQLRVREGVPHAQLLFISNYQEQLTADSTLSWLPLLEAITAEAGRHGILSLEAEVEEDGDELLLLREAGFVVYTRQDIWQLTTPPANPIDLPLQPRQSQDDWDIQLLYANIVPRLIQQVEPHPPLSHGESWVLREGDELVAFAHITTGSAGAWWQLFLHPNAQATAETLIQALIQRHPPQPDYPIYCCVRRYQSWLERPLEKVGFHHNSSQAVMVKHTVQRIERPVSDLSALMEAKAVTNGQTGVVQRSQQVAPRSKFFKTNPHQQPDEDK